ncbi:Serine/threonine-protein kinase [Gracilaria domingensis]|nr:Serine/threonine-protein kinase [Gracilaria domingensis]
MSSSSRPGAISMTREELGVALNGLDEGDDVGVRELAKHGGLAAGVARHVHVLQAVLAHDLDGVQIAGVVVDAQHDLGEHADAQLLGEPVATHGAGRHVVERASERVHAAQPATALAAAPAGRGHAQERRARNRGAAFAPKKTAAAERSA